MLQVNVTLEQYKRALIRVHEHRPPAATREQYRDCLLWEVLLDNHDGQSALVTADNDFLKKGAANKGLAQLLRDETKNEVKHYSSLSDYLVASKQHIPPMDTKPIEAEIVNTVHPILEEYAQDKGFQYGQLKNSEVELFAIEQPDSTAVVFKLIFPAYEFPLPNESIVDEVEVVVQGNCIINMDNKATNLSMERITVYSLSGEHLPGGIVYGSVSIGESRHIPYRVKTPIIGKTL